MNIAEESQRIEMLEDLFHKNNLAWSQGMYSEYLEFLKTYVSDEEGAVVNRYTRMMDFIRDVGHSYELEEKDVAPEDRAHLLQKPTCFISIGMGSVERKEDAGGYLLLMEIELKPYTKMSEDQALCILEAGNDMMESFYDPKLQQLLLKSQFDSLRRTLHGVGKVKLEQGIHHNSKKAFEKYERSIHEECYHRKDEINMIIDIHDMKRDYNVNFKLDRTGQCDGLIPALRRCDVLEHAPMVVEAPVLPKNRRIKICLQNHESEKILNLLEICLNDDEMFTEDDATTIRCRLDDLLFDLQREGKLRFFEFHAAIYTLVQGRAMVNLPWPRYIGLTERSEDLAHFADEDYGCGKITMYADGCEEQEVWMGHDYEEKSMILGMEALSIKDKDDEMEE
jgi:hypothetical protein